MNAEYIGVVVAAQFDAIARMSCISVEESLIDEALSVG
jgi:hypothetical protein